MDTRIQTFTGRMVDPLALQPEDVNIDDIAASLSKLCRYTGHTRHFYSVAEHSVYISRLVPYEFALWGLLHDASEAYLGDIARPLKQTTLYAEYREIETRVMRVICERFGLPEHEPRCVKDWDNAIIEHEAKALMHYNEEWVQRTTAGLVPPPTLVIVGVIPVFARSMFLRRFWELYG